MKFSRRDVIKGMGAAGLTPMLASGCGSDSGTNLPPLPELPEYEFDGTPGPETMFEHGVASGDPLPDGVILWTRVSPEVDGEIEVWWEMALDPEFTQRTAQATRMTDSSVDYTIKVDVSDLIWGREYYYRFFAQGRQSPIGRTRLAPSGDQASRLRFGLCSCSNYGFGFFYGYRHMAARSDLDAVIHVGDYFYDYENGNFPTEENQVRLREPAGETITLEDYRTRLGQFHRDPDLAELHRQVPFIVVWDDHETANNSWMGGAENHDPETEGSWEDRVAAARQAFFEWIPIRETPGRRLYRTVKYGDLADIFMLDTRIEGREEQFSAIAFPPDQEGLPDQLLGPEQEAWLQAELMNSTAKWRILGNQVVMSFWNLGGLLANSDQWHGYPGARGRFMSFLRDNEISNVVVLTGDVHSSWAMDVTVGDGSYDGTTQDGAVAVEFVTPGITSPFEIEGIVNAIRDSSPHIRYVQEELSRGYVAVDVQADKVQADWYFLDGVGEGQGNQSFGAAWAVMDGQARLTEMDGPETDNEDTPPLAPPNLDIG